MLAILLQQAHGPARPARRKQPGYSRKVRDYLYAHGKPVSPKHIALQTGLTRQQVATAVHSGEGKWSKRQGHDGKAYLWTHQ